jgi:hypothetical protein
VRSNSIKTDLIKFCNVSTFEKMVIYCRSVEMVGDSVKEYELASEPSVLNFFQEGVVKSRDVST